MSDEMLLQTILDRLTTLDSKVDAIKEAIHEQDLNEQEQNTRLAGIEARMGAFEAFQTTVTTQLEELKKACSSPAGTVDDDEEIAQGFTAVVRKVLRNPKVLWPIIAVLAATGVIKSEMITKVLGIATPAAVVAPEVIQ